MTLKTILRQQKSIERHLKKTVHPESPMVFHLNRKYRELENLKTTT